MCLIVIAMIDIRSIVVKFKLCIYSQYLRPKKDNLNYHKFEQKLIFEHNKIQFVT